MSFARPPGKERTAGDAEGARVNGRPPRWRRRSLLGLASAWACALAGCGMRGGALRVGFLGALSGRDAQPSQDARNGAQLAIDQLNAAGGVRGRPLHLVVEDYGGGREHEQAAAHRLIEAGVHAVVGPLTSAVASRVLPLFDAARMLLISPTVSADGLAGRDDYLVRLNVSTSDGMRFLATALHARGWRRATVLRDLRNAEAALPYSAHFREHFVADGGAIVQQLDFGTAGPIAFADLVRRAVAMPTDGLLLLADSVDAARIAQQAARQAPGLRLATSDWAANPDLIELGGKAVEGLVLAQPYDESHGSAYFRAIHTAYIARFGREPNFGAMSSFDAVVVLATALERAPRGEAPREAVLRHGPYPGIQQALNVDRFGDVQRAMVVHVVRDGRLVKA